MWTIMSFLVNILKKEGHHKQLHSNKKNLNLTDQYQFMNRIKI